MLRPAGRRRGYLAAESWGDGEPVYLLHGWGGHRGQMTGFAGPLAARGCRAVAVDAPAHGGSGPGRHGPGRCLLPDFTAALLTAADRYGPPRAVIAHSMGAAAAALASLDGQIAPRRLVLIAPAAPLAAADALARRAGAGSRVRARMLYRLAARCGAAPAHFDLVSRAAEREDMLPALLVIHDGSDRQVPFAAGAELACAWPAGQLHRTAGLGHHAILRDPAVIRLAVAFATAARATEGTPAQS